MLDFAVPHTPPRSASKPKNQKLFPVFQLPLQTPKTPKRKVDKKLTTPGQQPQGLLLPPTPDFTPHKSPRRRRKLIVEELFAVSENVGLLLPNHAMVGSGRRLLPLQKPLKSALDFEDFSLIHSKLDFEEDLFEDLFEANLMASPTKKRHVKGPKHEKQVAQTPGNQLITDEKVNLWHGKSFNTCFSSDEESDVELAPHELHNPFLDPPAVQKKTLSKAFQSKLPVDYSTHIEYINHRTGERRVEELTEEQKQFKPKKIDFSKI